MRNYSFLHARLCALASADAHLSKAAIAIFALEQERFGTHGVQRLRIQQLAADLNRVAQHSRARRMRRVKRNMIPATCSPFSTSTSS